MGEWNYACCLFSASTSENGRHAGQAALEGDHGTCLGLLLRRGADLETKNQNQQTLLECIRKKYGQTKTDKLLKDSGNKWGGGWGGGGGLRVLRSH